MFKFFIQQSYFAIALILFLTNNVISQQTPLFKLVGDNMGVRFDNILCLKDGSILISSSIGILKLKGNEMKALYIGLTGKRRTSGSPRHNLGEDSILAMAEGADGILFYVTHDNNIHYALNSDSLEKRQPPFVFPPQGKPFDKVSAMFIDNSGDLFIGSQTDNFYWIKGGANKQVIRKSSNKNVDSKIVPYKGELPVKKITIAPYYGVFSFAQDSTDKNIIWVGTNHGLYNYNKVTGKSTKISGGRSSEYKLFTVTHIELDKFGKLWFSTLETGMCSYSGISTINGMKIVATAVYGNPLKKSDKVFRIKTFCFKSENDLYVAMMDTLPAIFNLQSHKYTFISDPSFKQSVDRTTDVKQDKLGNLFLIKGGMFYICNTPEREILDSNLLTPFIRSIVDLKGEEIASINNKPEHLKELKLKYENNSFIVFYDMNDFGDRKKAQFAWKIEGVTEGWVVMPAQDFERANIAFIQNLKPGKYVFEVKVKVGNEDWRKQQGGMIIIITSPFWQTWWFWTTVISGLATIIGIFLWWRIRAVKKREMEKFAHEKQILELEAKALRAQMNPHFIFNCLNSIKSLIQQHDEEKSVSYLTTFSKLIRNLFNSADKKEINLYDEIETCKLYLQLEAMRFDTKFSFAVHVDETIDLKSIQIPALIIQPFIENAIWHGIVPRNSGGNVSLNVLRKNEVIELVIDDDGIGRAASEQNKSASGLAHQSKGVNLTQTRLELNNLLQQRQAKLEIIDKKDENGMATGTTVIIKIKEELS